MFLRALFRIASQWKPPKYLSMVKESTNSRISTQENTTQSKKKSTTDTGHNLEDHNSRKPDEKGQSYKRLHTTQFHVHNILHMTKLEMENREQICGCQGHRGNVWGCDSKE